MNNSWIGSSNDKDILKYEIHNLGRAVAMKISSVRILHPVFPWVQEQFGASTVHVAGGISTFNFLYYTYTIVPMMIIKTMAALRIGFMQEEQIEETVCKFREMDKKGPTWGRLDCWAGCQSYKMSNILHGPKSSNQILPPRKARKSRHI